MAEAAVYIMMAASAAVTVVGQQQQAKSQESALEYQAKQQERKAGEERAVAQRQAQEQRRQAVLAISRAQALTGGSSTDDGVLDAVGDIAAEGEYLALTALYEGEERGLGREMQASGFRMQGAAGRSEANWKSASTIFNTGTSMSRGGTGTTLYSNYGNGGFGNYGNYGGYGGFGNYGGYGGYGFGRVR